MSVQCKFLSSFAWDRWDDLPEEMSMHWNKINYFDTTIPGKHWV